MQDLRDAFRALRTAPVVSIVAILSLALGIGANTAIFTIVDSLLFEPLPVREPHRLVLLGTDRPNVNLTVNHAVWQEVRDRRLLKESFAWATDRVGVAEAGETVLADAIWASGDFFAVLGVPAALGRTFGRGDDRPGGGPDGPVAVISHRMWQARFAGAADVLGRPLTISGVPVTIVGVTPPGFFGLNVGAGFDVVLPLETESLMGQSPPRVANRFWPWLQIMGRPGGGQTPASLTAALRAVQPHIREATMPGFERAEDRDAYLAAAWTLTPSPSGVSRLRRQYGPALLTLLGIVGVVLLAACANIATLLLARTSARRYEFSVRLALGASRGRLVRQLLAESLLLSAIGAACGLAFAQGGSRLLVAQLSTWYATPSLDLSPGWRVLALTAATTIATALLFGTVPAYVALAAEPIEALKRQPRGGARDAAATLGGGLVVVQVALSLMLAVGAGLFVRSFAALAYRDLGFDRGRVLVAVVDAQKAALPAPGLAALFEHVREAAGAVAGVESAATSMATPLGSAGVRFTPELAFPENAELAGHGVRIFGTPVSPDWFRTYGTRMLAGRDFDAHDSAAAPRVVIVNESFARRYFPNASPVGRTIVQVADAGQRRPMEIVGIVEDAAFASVRDPIEPAIYQPLLQGVDDEMLESQPSVSLSVRAPQGTSPDNLRRAVAAAIAGVDPRLPVTFQSLSETLSVHYIRERLLAMLAGFFGALALLLAALGLYGVTSYAVSRRRTEIGIRMALGADAPAMVRMVLGRLTLLTGVGIAAGAAATLWAAHFIEPLLFHLTPRDPLTFAVAAVVLALVAIAAGWLPARRATRIDPAVVLRAR